MFFVGIVFGIAGWFAVRFWLSRRRRPAPDLAEEETRARRAQFDSNAKPEEAYVLLLGRATLNKAYQNFTRQPNVLLFEGSRRYTDGGFLYYVQFWKRDSEVSGAVGLRWHTFHSAAEVNEAHKAFFEFVRSALTDQGFSFQSKWTLDAPANTATAPRGFGKRVEYRPPNLRGELPAHRRHFVVEGQPDWATTTGISWLDGKGWRLTERLKVSATAVRVAFESEGATQSDGFDLIVETTDKTREKIAVTLALQPRGRFPSPATAGHQLERLEKTIRSNAAKILAE